MKAIGIAAVALALAACSQTDAPSDEVAEAAEDIVEGGQPSPGLADGKFAPRDECGDLEGSALFRQRLALAVEARDAEGVAVLAAEDVKLDFGGGAGRAELVELLDDPDGAMWKQLDELLALGCAENAQGGLTLPWYFEQDIPGDPYATMIVTGENVPLLSAANAEAQPLATLDWDAVELADGLEPDKPFQKVEFGGKTGFVATASLRSQIAYRLLASSRNGRWRIVSLVAGD